MTKPFLLYLSVVFVVFSVTGCGTKSLDELSPKEALELYYQARDDGDVELLQQIVYFPPNISEAQRRTKLAVTCADEKAMMAIADIHVEYEKILNDDTAEAGAVIFMGIPGWRKRVPFQQIILKKEEGRWKYSHSKHELSEDQLIDIIRENPHDASAIYLLGRKYQTENSAKANRYYRKYCELEPKGFWISKELMDRLKRYADIEKVEDELLGRVPNIPEQSPDRASIYWTLGQLFGEDGEYEKAKIYFDKAEKILMLKPKKNIYDIERFNKVKKEFELEVNDKSLDILTELESKGVYQ